MSRFDLHPLRAFLARSYVLVHMCEFGVGKFTGGEEFDRNDIEMGHGIYDSEFVGVGTDASEAVIPPEEVVPDNHHGGVRYGF